MSWIEGELDPYWEQAMEGAFLYSLSVPNASEPFFFHQGDLLDILDHQGNELLWSGTFQLRKRRFWESHRLKTRVYSDTVLKGLSYSTWMEWLWSRPRLFARIWKPDEDNQIVYARQTRPDQRPIRLRDAGMERCLGREVLEWSANRGSYGMGGPGFFGLRLKSNGKYPEEWFTLTLWGAADWLLLNDRWVSAHPRYYHIQEPLYSNFGEDQTWDEVTTLIEGALLEEMEVDSDHFVLTLCKGSVRVCLQLPQHTDRLPRFGGTDRARSWNPAEEVQDAWVFCEGSLYC